MTPAVFLDRDGTLVHDPGFLRDPGEVRLLDGAGPALHRLAAADFRLVVITNQSGIARGIVAPDQLAAVNAAIDARLADHGVTIAGWYHCPHAPDAGCDCRKPGTALHRAAAAALDLDLARSWCVGDRPSDLEPARVLGARAVLVRTGEGSRHAAAAHAAGYPVADDLPTAAALILGVQRTANREQRS